MVILGVDPGLARTGWGVIHEDKGKLRVGEYGCVETGKGLHEATRLLEISTHIKRILKEVRPEVLAIEKLFFNTNVTNALSVGQARGVVLLAAQESGVIIDEYTPLQVKIAVTGYGRADKNQVGQMVKSILGLSSVPKPDDTADALAVALTHAVSYKVKNVA